MAAIGLRGVASGGAPGAVPGAAEQAGDAGGGRVEAEVLAARRRLDADPPGLAARRVGADRAVGLSRGAEGGPALGRAARAGVGVAAAAERGIAKINPGANRCRAHLAAAGGGSGWTCARSSPRPAGQALQVTTALAVVLHAFPARLQTSALAPRPLKAKAPAEAARRNRARSDAVTGSGRSCARVYQTARSP